jgi:hypothetical protein
MALHPRRLYLNFILAAVWTWNNTNLLLLGTLPSQPWRWRQYVCNEAHVLGFWWWCYCFLFCSGGLTIYFSVACVLTFIR